MNNKKDMNYANMINSIAVVSENIKVTELSHDLKKQNERNFKAMNVFKVVIPCAKELISCIKVLKSTKLPQEVKDSFVKASILSIKQQIKALKATADDSVIIDEKIFKEVLYKRSNGFDKLRIEVTGLNYDEAKENGDGEIVSAVDYDHNPHNRITAMVEYGVTESIKDTFKTVEHNGKVYDRHYDCLLRLEAPRQLQASTELYKSDDIIIFHEKIKTSSKAMVTFLNKSNFTRDEKSKILELCQNGTYENVIDYVKEIGQNIEKYTHVYASASGLRLTAGDVFAFDFIKGGEDEAIAYLNEIGFVDALKDKYTTIEDGVREVLPSSTVSNVRNDSLRFAAANTQSLPIARVNVAVIIKGKFETSIDIPTYLDFAQGKLKKYLKLDADGECLFSYNYMVRNLLLAHAAQTRPESHKEQTRFSSLVASIFTREVRRLGCVLILRNPETGKVERFDIDPTDLTVDEAMAIGKLVDYIGDMNSRKVNELTDEYFEMWTLKLVQSYKQRNEVCSQIIQKISNVSTAEKNNIVQSILEKSIGYYENLKSNNLYQSIRYSEMFDKNSCGSIEFDSNLSKLKALCDKLNRGSFPLQSRNVVLNPFYGGIYGWFNALGTAKHLGKEIPVVYYGGKLTKADKRMLKANNNVVTLIRTPSPDAKSGITVKVITSKKALARRINEQYIIHKDKMELVAMNVLKCSKEEAERAVEQYIKDLMLDVRVAKDGLFVPAHPDLLEALGGADFDTDTAFMIFDPTFTNAVAPYLESNARDFGSLGRNIDNTPVNFNSVRYKKAIISSFYQVAENTETGTGIETSKIDWFLAMANCAYSSDEQEQKKAVFMFKALCKAYGFSPKYSSTIKYISCIKRNSIVNELGWVANRSVVNINHYKTILKAMRECAPTLENIRAIAKDLETVCCFIADGVIDAAKKEYEIESLKVGFGVYTNKVACVVNKDLRREGILSLDIVDTDAKNTYYENGDYKTLYIDTIATKITKLIVSALNSIVGSLKASSKKNVSCFRAGESIYKTFGPEKREILRQIFQHYNNFCAKASREEDMNGYQEMTHYLRMATASLVNDPKEVFPVLYYYYNKSASTVKFGSTPYQIAGPYCADYLFEDGMVFLKCVEIAEEDRVEGKEVSLKKYGLSNVMKNAFVVSYEEDVVIDGRVKEVTKYAVKGEKLQNHIETSVISGFILHDKENPTEEDYARYSQQFLDNAFGLLSKVVGHTSKKEVEKALANNIYNRNVYFCGNPTHNKIVGTHKVEGEEVLLIENVHTNLIEKMVGAEDGFANVGGNSYFIILTK